MLNRIYFAETGRKTIGFALYPYMLSPLCQYYYRRLLLKILADGGKKRWVDYDPPATGFHSEPFGLLREGIAITPPQEWRTVSILVVEVQPHTSTACRHPDCERPRAGIRARIGSDDTTG